jgi:multidrug resistance efflux pump
MSNNPCIPTPWKLRLTRFCYRGLPVLGFVGCLTATLWLWQRQGNVSMLAGEVVAVRMDVTSRSDGQLAPLPREPWSLYDRVEADQVIARLDDRAVLAQLDVGRKELARIRADLDAAVVKNSLDQGDRDLNYASEATRLAVEHQRTLLWLLERRIQSETDRLELRRCEARIEHLKPLHEKNAIPKLQWVEEDLARNIVAKRLDEGLAALREAEIAEKTLREQAEKLPARVAAEAAKLLTPFRAAIESQQARVRELELAGDHLIVRSPINGVICAILRRPGENVRAGDPIVTVTDPRGQGIVSYLRQEDRLRPQPGMAAEVRPRLLPGRTVATRVERVGPQFEPIPLHLCRDPKTPEWGLPVFIAVPDGLPVRPGELLDVRLRPEGG